MDFHLVWTRVPPSGAEVLAEMDFQCDRCAQKYHVADEKLQGRAVSRFKCKKCENVILLTAPAPVAPPAATPLEPGSSPLRAPTASAPLRPQTVASPAVSRSATMPGAKPRPLTTTGPAYSGARPGTVPAPAPGAVARASQLPPPAGDPDENGWFAGIRDVPVGPVSRAELRRYVESGEATGETLVWRDGFGDWRPLRLVPALKELLPSLRVVSQRPAVPVQSFSDNDGDATTVTSGPALLAGLAAAAPPAKPPEQEAPTRRLSALTEDHLRAIRLPPVAGAPDKAAAKKTPTGQRPAVPATPTAPATPPVPSARSTMAPATPPRPSVTPGAPPPPTARTSAVPAPPATPPGARPSGMPGAPAPRPATLGGLRPESAPKPAGLGGPLPRTPLGAPKPPPVTTPSARTSSVPEVPAARSTPPAAQSTPPVSLVEPVSEAPTEHMLGALTPPALATPSLPMDDAGEVPSLDALASSPVPSTTVPSSPSLEPEPLSAPAPAPAPATPAAAEGWNDPLFQSEPPPSKASGPVAGMSKAWADPVFNSMAPPAPAAAVAVALKAPAPETPSIAPAVTGPIPVTVDVARPKPRGFPKGVLVLAAGLAVVGIAGGIALSKRNTPPVATATSPTPAPTEAPAPTPTAAPTGPAPTTQAVIAAPGETTPTEAPGSPDMVFSGDNSPGRRHRPATGGNAPPTPLTQAQQQAALERALGIRGGAPAPAPSIPPTPTRTPSPLPQANTPSLPSPTATTQPSAQPQSFARNAAREREGANAIERSGLVRRCWEQFKLRNPAAPARSLSINFSVAESGQISVRVPDHSEPILTNCIERGQGIRPLPVGGTASGSTRADLN